MPDSGAAAAAQQVGAAPPSASWMLRRIPPPTPPPPETRRGGRPVLLPHTGRPPEVLLPLLPSESAGTGTRTCGPTRDAALPSCEQHRPPGAGERKGYNVPARPQPRRGGLPLTAAAPGDGPRSPVPGSGSAPPPDSAALPPALPPAMPPPPPPRAPKPSPAS